MASCLQLYLVKMKLQTQFLAMISILFALIISILIALHVAQVKSLIYLLQQSSDLIFKQSSQLMQSNVINWQKSYLDKMFFLSKNQLYVDGNALITLHRLYHATINQVVQGSLEENKNYQMDFAGTKQLPDLIRIINGYGQHDLSYSFTCYTNLSDFENPLALDEQIAIKAQEQFQSFGQILFSGEVINQLLLQTYVKKEKILSVYPCVNRGEEIYGFHVEQRDWYVELKRNFDSKMLYNSYNCSFTKPYLCKISQFIVVYTLKKIGLSIVMPLVDKDLKMIGGLTAMFTGNELVQSIKQSNFGFQIIYLVSDEGVMIMHPYQADENTVTLYIYNETITGFNMTDWLQIQSKISESSCSIFTQHDSGLKCRYNSLYKQEMIIGSYRFEEFKLILIMLQSSQEYYEFYKDFQNKLEISIQQLLSKNILIEVGMFIFFSLIVYKSTELLFKAIRFVTRQALSLISKQEFRKNILPKFSQLFMSEEIQQIFEQFELLKKKFDLLSFQKTSYCSEIEKYKYPEKYLNQKLNIQSQINQLKTSKFQKNKKVGKQLTLKQIFKILKSSFRNGMI